MLIMCFFPLFSILPPSTHLCYVFPSFCLLFVSCYLLFFTLVRFLHFISMVPLALLPQLSLSTPLLSTSPLPRLPFTFPHHLYLPPPHPLLGLYLVSRFSRTYYLTPRPPPSPSPYHFSYFSFLSPFFQCGLHPLFFIYSNALVFCFSHHCSVSPANVKKNV